MSPSPTVPEPPASPPPPDPAADPSAAGPGKDRPEQRTSSVLVILLLAVNVLFVLLIGPVHGLAALNQDVSNVNGDQVSGGWFLFWPGMLIVWGAAWLAFSYFGVKKRIRSALIAFVLTAALWLIPMALYVASLLAGG